MGKAKRTCPQLDRGSKAKNIRYRSHTACSTPPPTCTYALVLRSLRCVPSRFRAHSGAIAFVVRTRWVESLPVLAPKSSSARRSGLAFIAAVPDMDWRRVVWNRLSSASQACGKDICPRNTKGAPEATTRQLCDNPILPGLGNCAELHRGSVRLQGAESPEQGGGGQAAAAAQQGQSPYRRRVALR